jgi:PilZ domain
MPHATGRCEKRSATTVAVMLTSQDPEFPTELTLTENISAGGARVVTKKHWSENEYLFIKSLAGDLQSGARVIYCQPIRKNVYAIGLQLLAPTGRWHRWAL